MLQKTVVDEMELGYWGLPFMSFDSTFQARKYECNYECFSTEM